MLEPSLPGWKVECVGDDICWMKFGKDGRLYAINPEAGFFGVAPGTSYSSNPNAMRTLTKNCLFTNVALTSEGDVWWEGMTKEKPERLTSWLRKPWTPAMQEDAAHPNSRFTVPASQCPVIDPKWENPEGVPIEAIIFGGRRSTTVPLVYQSLNWEHGSFVGSIVNSETTAAAVGQRGVLRADPYAMKPFCGYNMGDYMGHWIKMGTSAPDPDKLPKIFHVNWFKKTQGRFLWPGFGQNARVLKWMFERISDPNSPAESTPIGWVPTPESLDVSGLDIDGATVKELLRVDKGEWQGEVTKYKEYLQTFGDRLPAGIKGQLDELGYRVQNSSQ